jgi:hypothetical protein
MPNIVGREVAAVKTQAAVGPPAAGHLWLDASKLADTGAVGCSGTVGR